MSEIFSQEWCYEYCKYSRRCINGKAAIGKEPMECDQYLLLDSLAFDAQKEREEELKEMYPYEEEIIK
jgi:hypothetical protein